jgi:hypothetical protein
LLFTTETGEDTEVARRIEYRSTLCASSVLSPVSVVKIELPYAQFKIASLLDLELPLSACYLAGDKAGVAEQVDATDLVI